MALSAGGDLPICPSAGLRSKSTVEYAHVLGDYMRMSGGCVCLWGVGPLKLDRAIWRTIKNFPCVLWMTVTLQHPTTIPPRAMMTSLSNQKYRSLMEIQKQKPGA